MSGCVEASLDTHAFLWLVQEPERLPGTVSEAVAKEGNELFLSVVSLWEVTIKAAKGTLGFHHEGVHALYQLLVDFQINLLHIQQSHLSVLETLPMHHKDPFDRLILSQAICDGLTLVSVDQLFAQYPVRTLWQ